MEYFLVHLYYYISQPHDYRLVLRLVKADGPVEAQSKAELYGKTNAPEGHILDRVEVIATL